MTNPLIEGIADGLKPSALAAPMRAGDKLGKQDTIPVHEAAAINIAAKLGRLEALQERAVKAAEKQADAMETFVALFASVIGQAYAWCPGETEASPVVNYIRSGTGESFNCDKEADDD